jgi:hypothetical protein
MRERDTTQGEKTGRRQKAEGETKGLYCPKFTIFSTINI